MLGQTPRLAAALFGLSVLVAAPAAAVDEPPTQSTLLVPATPAPSAGELAPGESPGTLELESGPVIDDPEDPTTTTTGLPAGDELPPAGPILLDDSLLNDGATSTTTALYLIMLTAVPSLTVGTALWIQRGDALARRRLARATKPADGRRPNRP